MMTRMMKIKKTAPVRTMKNETHISICMADKTVPVGTMQVHESALVPNHWPYLIEGMPKISGSSLRYANEVVVKCKELPINFLNRWCMESGSSLRGRTDAFMHLTGVRVKVPCLISEYSRLIYFPIYGLKHSSNIWVCYQSVFTYKDCNGFTLLRFIDGSTRIIAVSYRSIKLQMKRCESFLDQVKLNNVVPVVHNLLHEADYE